MLIEQLTVVLVPVVLLTDIPLHCVLVATCSAHPESDSPKVRFCHSTPIEQLAMDPNNTFAFDDPDEE